MVIVEVTSHRQVLSVAKKLAKSESLLSVGIRFFRKDQVERVVQTGTDRSDADSRVWCDENDFRGVRPANITPGIITYMREIDVVSKPAIIVGFNGSNGRYGDSLDYLRHMDADMAQVIYNPTKMRRVSLNEWWFISDPKEALLAIITRR
ncbi:hypothetical protein KBC75_00200 [Candidatus Shapirobacteria bacterium]|nr:hypothetical protein [Candidatus Shapirobacteria bacterium]